MDIFEGVKAPCCMGSEYIGPCICTHDERVLREYAYGSSLSEMTLPQREWCIQEADSAGEGMYNESELSKMTDKELAGAVITAWNAYVQSNCI